MFRTKQIAMVAILGLALVLATATVVYTQSAQAALPGGGPPPPTHRNQNVQGNDDSQGNEAGGPATACGIC